MKTESRINLSNNANRAYGFSLPRPGKLRYITAMLGGAVAGLLLAAPAVARDDDDRGKVDHVLLVSVDGMHQSDLAWYVQTHPQSTLAALTAQGVDYSNASTPFPSDSYPGMIAQATGGNPSTTGAYYDDTWNHAVFPPGTTNFAAPVPGAEVTYQEPLTKTIAPSMPERASCRRLEPDPWADILRMTATRPTSSIRRLPVDPNTRKPIIPANT